MRHTHTNTHEAQNNVQQIQNKDDTTINNKMCQFVWQHVDER